jgi:hypothetical protein
LSTKKSKILKNLNKILNKCLVTDKKFAKKISGLPALDLRAIGVQRFFLSAVLSTT